MHGQSRVKYRETDQLLSPSHQTSTDRTCREEDAVQMQVEVIKYPCDPLKQSCDYHRQYDQNNAIN